MIDWNHVYFLGDYAGSDVDRVGMNAYPGITKQNMVFGEGPLQYFLIPDYLTGPVGTGSLRLRCWYEVSSESSCT